MSFFYSLSLSLLSLPLSVLLVPLPLSFSFFSIPPFTIHHILPSTSFHFLWSLLRLPYHFFSSSLSPLSSSPSSSLHIFLSSVIFPPQTSFPLIYTPSHTPNTLTIRLFYFIFFPSFISSQSPHCFSEWWKILYNTDEYTTMYGHRSTNQDY